jgi:hypothetical protein
VEGYRVTPSDRSDRDIAEGGVDVQLGNSGGSLAPDPRENRGYTSALVPRFFADGEMDGVDIIRTSEALEWSLCSS